MSSALAGFGASLALIVAIGPQNAFLLRQGLVRRHVWTVVAICLAADVVLISAGVAGLAAAIGDRPALLVIARVAGGLFLLAFAARSLYRAARPDKLEAAERGATTRRAAVGATLAMTFLNPHVYLDMILLGSIANALDPGGLWWFVGGALVASALWFIGLGAGAHLLAPLLRRASSWRFLDLGIAVTMGTLGAILLLG